jgi:hypothetical protein
MKKIFKVVLFLFIGLFLSVCSVLADPPQPPDPGGGTPGGGGIPVGAPIEDGFIVMLLLAASYLGFKIYEIRKKAKREQHSVTLK